MNYYRNAKILIFYVIYNIVVFVDIFDYPKYFIFIWQKLINNQNIYLNNQINVKYFYRPPYIFSNDGH